MSTPLYQIPSQPARSFGNLVAPLLQEEDVAANVERAAAHAANIAAHAANIAANTEDAAVSEEPIVAEASVEDYLEELSPLQEVL